MPELVGALAFAAHPFVIIRQRLVGRRHVEMPITIGSGRRLAAGAQRIGCHLAERFRPAGRHLRLDSIQVVAHNPLDKLDNVSPHPLLFYPHERPSEREAG